MKKLFNKIAFIVLAAGLGTRMKSNKAKVLHELNGKPMILYIIETSKTIVGKNIIVVVGYQADNVMAIISEQHEVCFAMQDKQLGTGHAVLKAVPYIEEHIENIVILCGDVPLVTMETLKKLIFDHVSKDCDMTILAVQVTDPKGYGRIIVDDKNMVTRIVEETDSNEDEKKINIINSGIYCIRKKFLLDAISKIKPSNVQGEFYFTDIIHIGYQEQKKIQAIKIGNDPFEFMGINSCEDLEKAEKIVYTRNHKRP
jgi:UDP-N-acetylglucosamine diphosphorylase/glucosamine-1-phosphate N-acetyltransferase